MFVVAVACAGVLIAGCGDDDDDDTGGATSPAAPAETAPASGGAAKASAKVDIKDFKYIPATVTVKSGGKVTWKNFDSAPHNSENKQNPKPVEFTTKTPLKKGQSDTVTFSKPGTYRYYCVYHRFMEADVIVK